MTEEIFQDLAHKLKTPLTACLLNIELARKEIADGSYSQADNLLLRSVRSIFRLSSTCESFLDDARIKDSKLIEQLNLSQLIKEVVDNFSILLKNQRLILNIKSNILFDGNKSLIEEMVLNLLDNSLKFTDPEKGIISVSLSKIQTISNLDQDNQRFNQNDIVLTISDNGSGVSKDQLSKIFNRYYQAEAKAGTAGIGLDLVKKIVDIHQGQIKIVNNNPTGLTVVITLPNVKSTED